MALTVETGSGSVASESYASVADADSYCTLNGKTSWLSLSQSEKEQALRRASSYMIQRYRQKWSGYRMQQQQALDWPRTLVPVSDVFGFYRGTDYVADNIVPPLVRNACVELAVLAAVEDLNPPAKQGVISKTIGPIKIVYDVGSPEGTRYSHVDQMLAIYLSATAGGMKLSRV